MPEAHGEEGSPQLPSAQPPEADIPPSETAKAENFFFRFLLPQEQTNSSFSERTRNSVVLPHFSQVYSKMGIVFSFYKLDPINAPMTAP